MSLMLVVPMGFVRARARRTRHIREEQGVCAKRRASLSWCGRRARLPPPAALARVGRPAGWVKTNGPVAGTR